MSGGDGEGDKTHGQEEIDTGSVSVGLVLGTCEKRTAVLGACYQGLEVD